MGPRITICGDITESETQRELVAALAKGVDFDFQHVRREDRNMKPSVSYSQSGQVLLQPSGQVVLLQPSGQVLLLQPSGQVLLLHPSGQVLLQPSGQVLLQPSGEVPILVDGNVKK